MSEKNGPMQYIYPSNPERNTSKQPVVLLDVGDGRPLIPDAARAGAYQGKQGEAVYSDNPRVNPPRPSR